MLTVVPSINRSMLELHIKVIVNRTVTIDCPVSGIPVPDIVWLRNGDLLDPVFHPNIQFLSGGRQLRVLTAAVSDTAVYRCLATNKAGKDNIDFNLAVQS